MNFNLFFMKICSIVVAIGNENKQMWVLPLIPRFYREIGGGVYGRIFTIPNLRIYDFCNYKRSLIDSYIYNVDKKGIK